jgi:Kef-type K+ transport system membrane component KefB
MGLVAAVGNWSGVRRRVLVGLLIAAPLLAVVVMLFVARMHEDAGSAAAAVPPGPADPYPRLLVALPVILATCYLVGVVAKRLGQPRVIGEIVAGVLLGPSLFGLVWPGGFGWLFPAAVVGAINTLAQLGLILFMYLVGAEVDLPAVRRRGVAAATISQVSIAWPMLLGVVLGFAMYPSFGHGVAFSAFALFLAASMSVTAFPVLARILADRRMTRTSLGALALTCAAIDDVAAWCLLAVVVAIARGHATGGVGVTIVLVIAFAAVLIAVVRPLLARWAERVSETAVLPVMLGGIMLAALATDRIGVHPIFGAFLLGLISPRGVPAVRRAAGKMSGITVTLLLPPFFVYTGLHTRFGLLGTSGRLWAWCALITLMAILGKWGGSTAAARLTGIGWPDALSLGVLMNCRGLTELVVLSIGLQLGVIDPTVFTMLVIMALVSTMATGPGLSLIERYGRPPERSPTTRPQPPLGTGTSDSTGRPDDPRVIDPPSGPPKRARIR